MICKRPKKEGRLSSFCKFWSEEVFSMKDPQKEHLDV
jgi:hypothetical protein